MFSRETRIYCMLVMTSILFIAEIVIGHYVNSLALIADSFHMLNDLLSLCVALWAIKLSSITRYNPKYSYGWQRAEILGALINSVFLLALCFTILMDAIERFVSPKAIQDPVMVLITGGVGLVANLIGLLLFHEHGHGHGDPTEKGQHGHEGGHLNMRGIFLHVLGDALGNMGVIASALFIWLTPFSWRFYFDPLVSVLITIIIFLSALPLVKQTASILLQGVPRTVPLSDVYQSLLKVEGVKSVHELHVWQLSDIKLIASLHVLLESREGYMKSASDIRKSLHGFGIHSATIQPEFIDDDDKSQKNESSLYLNHPPDEGSTSSSTCLLRCIEASCLEDNCCPAVQ